MVNNNPSTSQPLPQLQFYWVGPPSCWFVTPINYSYIHQKHPKTIEFTTVICTNLAIVWGPLGAIHSHDQDASFLTTADDRAVADDIWTSQRSKDLESQLPLPQPKSGNSGMVQLGASWCKVQIWKFWKSIGKYINQYEKSVLHIDMMWYKLLWLDNIKNTRTIQYKSCSFSFI